MQKKTAYSLIEILLVISILAVSATLLINHFQREAEQKKVDLLVKEFETLFQGFKTYCIQHGSFGTNPADGWYPNFSDVQLPYLPFSSEAWRKNPYYISNPWGYRFEERTALQDGDPKTITKVYGLRTEVPTREIANQVAARLPFAIVDPSTNKVTAYIPIPGQEMAGKSGNSIYRIYSIGQARSNEFDVPVNCPQNWTPGVLTGIGGFQPDYSASAKDLYRVWEISINGSLINAKTLRIKAIFQGATKNVAYSPINMSQHPLLINYITYCKSP